MPRISPDGFRLTFDSRGLNRTIWVYDTVRGTRTAISSDGTPAYPIWAPDGKRIVFAAGAIGNRNLFWSPADGSASPERLTSSEFLQYPASWSGRTLLFVQIEPETGSDIWALTLEEGAPMARPILRTPNGEAWPALSPDGRWLAYGSTSSAHGDINDFQVYVQPYPELGPRHPISPAGGTDPAWSRDGRQLFYLQGRHLFSVDVTTGARFTAGIPRLVFELPEGVRFNSLPTPGYDVSPDGHRFLGSLVKPGPAERLPTDIQLTLNWFDELRARAVVK